jgi:hypothetical protein
VATATPLSNTVSGTGNITQSYSATLTVLPISPSNSTISVSPPSVAADGTSTSTIKVTLVDGAGTGVSGKLVKVTTPSSSIVNSSSGVTTDSNGLAVFTVTDTVAETATYTVTDSTDSITLTPATQTQVIFTSLLAPGVTMSFSPNPIAANGTSTLTITLTNSNAASITGVTFSDNYSGTLKNATSPNASTTCGASGATVIASAAGTSLKLNGGTIAAHGSCTVSVTVTAAVTETNTLAAGAVTTTNTAATSTSSSATLTVNAISADNSTISASPTYVEAGVSTFSTITVTLLDGAGNPVSGKNVTLTAASGSSLISPASGTSDSSGVVTFTVQDSTADGPIVYTAKDTTDGITLTNTATVTFGPSLTNSSVAASPTDVPADGVSSSTITVTLKDADNKAVVGKTIHLVASSGTAGITAVSNAGGVATFTVTDTVVETVTFTATDVEDSVTIGSVTVNFNAVVSSFNALETTIASVSNARIYTKTAGLPAGQTSGTAFSIDVAALDGSGNASSTFAGTVMVELIANNNSPGTLYGSDLCPQSGTVIQTIASQAITSGRSTVNFTAVSDVYQDVKVRISYPATSPTVVKCSTDSFAIRPDHLVLSATDADRMTAGTTNPNPLVSTTFGTVMHNAGRPFTITATAYDANGNLMTRYAGTPTGTAVSSCYVDATTTPACPQTVDSTAFSLGGGGWSSGSSGSVVNSTVTYAQVGSFALILTDSSFSSIDAGDLQGSSVTDFSSTTLNIGRFVPDHFELSAVSFANRADITGCQIATTGSINSSSNALNIAASDASKFSVNDYVVVPGAGALGADLKAKILVNPGTGVLTLDTNASVTVAGVAVYKHAFTYADEPFGISYTLVASNGLSSPSTIANYQGNFARATVSLQAEDSGNGVELSGRVTTSTFSWASGQYLVPANTNATFARNTTPDGPYEDLVVAVKVTDPDGSALKSSPVTYLSCTSGSTCSAAGIGRNKIRFGRLALSNAHGSELHPLLIPVEAQYWSKVGTGYAFATNTDDSCTVINASDFSIGNYTGNLISATVNTLNGGKMASGKQNLVISAPSATGSVDLWLNLSASSGSGQSCYSWTPATAATAGANLAYLRGKWCNTTYGYDPVARATFGIYKGSPIVYMREMH